MLVFISVICTVVKPESGHVSYVIDTLSSGLTSPEASVPDSELGSFLPVRLGTDQPAVCLPGAHESPGFRPQHRINRA